MAVYGFKILGQAFVRCVHNRQHIGDEESQSEPSKRDSALDRYRKTLQNMFGDRNHVDTVMVGVRVWTDGK